MLKSSSISLGNGLESIEEAFRNCGTTDFSVIPDSVTFIGGGVFVRAIFLQLLLEMESLKLEEVHSNIAVI